MKNLLSCCELTDARMRASEKDLPVHVEPNISFPMVKSLQKVLVC